MLKSGEKNNIGRTAPELFITLVTIVFVTNALTNLISNVLDLQTFQESLVDSILVIMVSYPALYLLIFRPLSAEISRRKKTEIELRRLASIVDSSNEAIMSSTLDGIIMTWNNGAEKMYGYKAEEIIGKHASVLAPADRAHEGIGILKKIGRGDRFEHYETIRKRKDGTLMHVSMMISQLRDPSGKIIGASAVVSDITERKRAEEMLRHAKDRAELLFRITPSAIFTVDTQKRITSWNNKAAEITGYPPEDVIGKSCLLFAGLPCGIECNMYDIKNTETIEAKECQIRTKNGRTLTVSKNSDILRSDDGQIMGRIESFEDITNRKALEMALRESRDYLHEIINAVADPIFVKDRRHRWTLLNKAYCEFMGHDEEHLLGKTDRDFFPEKEADVFWEKDEMVFNTGEENLSEEYFTDASGVTHYISTKKNLYTDIKGEKFIVGIIRDITERKKVEKLKDEFVGTVSHELRTPLSITKEGISLVLDHIAGPTNEQQTKILNTAKNNIDRLARIINDLLDISKIESGKAGLRIETFEVVSLVKEAISNFEAKIKDKGLGLSVNLPKESVVINGDRDGIMQVLTNLFSNSLKFTKEGRIEISVKDNLEMVEFSVSDTGIGIAKEDIPKLFEKFQQFSRTSGPGDRGTGLGLAIAKGIVSLHNGIISAESELGKGTRITFTVPKKI